jgi:hypothetical protein
LMSSPSLFHFDIFILPPLLPFDIFISLLITLLLIHYYDIFIITPLSQRSALRQPPLFIAASLRYCLFSATVALPLQYCFAAFLFCYSHSINMSAWYDSAWAATDTSIMNDDFHVHYASRATPPNNSSISRFDICIALAPLHRLRLSH